MKKLKLLVITLMMSLMSLSGYSYSNYGVWSSPNFFGDSYYRDSSGLTGSLSSPNFFGESHFDFSNGTRGYVTEPNFFGESYIYWNN